MKIFSKQTLSNHDVSLTFDDISLVPTEISEIRSRGEADTRVEFMGENLGLPVISSPMDSVTGVLMAEELSRLGCLGVVNRFDSSLNHLTGSSENNDGIKADN